MGWTDERVETLKKLWLDGLSASQIAKQLGGVTRNAVIGKVHRLGLSGRAAPSQPVGTVFKAPRPARAPATAIPVARQVAPVVEAVVEAVAAPPKPKPAPAVQTQAQAPSQAIALAPERGSATVLTLGARMCKWPIGDPSSDEFSFCGRRSSEDGPYCVDHARVAYQPHHSKKKAGSSDLARSVRRYV